ncbi:MAG: DUF2059 domain-containing protein [Pseudomonadota bacterium]
MKRIITQIALVAALAVAPLHAADGDKTALIERMFAVMGLDKQMNGGFEAMLPVVENMAAQLQLNSAEKEELKNIYRAWFREDFDRDAIADRMVGLYADVFSEQELRDVITFYESPTGQKFLDASSGLMQEAAQIGMQEGMAKQDRLLERLQPFLDKHRN